MALPDKREQILQAHAGLIHHVVRACHDPSLATALEPVLKTSEDNGWTDLVAALRRILAGRRDERLLADLDEEDRTIVHAVLRGLQDPATLPDPRAEADPAFAAPGLAAVIHAAARGDVQALHWLAQIAEQMTGVGGDMKRLGGILRRLVNGERDAEALCKGMGSHGEKLVLSILAELGKLSAH